MSKGAFYDSCSKMSLPELKGTPEYRLIPKHIKKSELTKPDLCKLLAIIHQANLDGDSREFFDMLKTIGGSKSVHKVPVVHQPPQVPNKYIRVIEPSRKLYHGRSVSKSAGVWETEDDFKKVMWWALERITPLMYASTSIKGRSLDNFYRWDVYESHLKRSTRFLVISKQSVQYLIEHYGHIKCEGETLGKWLKETFPIKNGKLYRYSHIDTDRKMAACMCAHIECGGYIASEIPIVDGPGKLHKEILVCDPKDTLKLKKYMGFSTRSGQQSVEDFLNELTTRLKPDTVKIY